MTTVPAATLFPLGGLVPVTIPLATELELFACTVNFSPAFVICDSAFATGRPSTCGTAVPELPPPKKA